VELAFAGDAVLVRDSKDANGPVMRFSHDAWRAFLAAEKVLPDGMLAGTRTLSIRATPRATPRCTGI
jgi:hypothetical protein